jgi:hypothetical protein
MNRTRLLTAATAAVAVTATVVAIGGAGASTPQQTLTLHGKPLQMKSLGKSHQVEVDVLRAAGRRVGYAAESCFFGGQGDKCAVTITLKNGVLYGHYTFPISNGAAPTTAKGKITGGLAGYAGVSGSIKVVATSSSETITVTYG